MGVGGHFVLVCVGVSVYIVSYKDVDLYDDHEAGFLLYARFRKYKRI